MNRVLVHRLLILHRLRRRRRRRQIDATGNNRLRHRHRRPMAAAAAAANFIFLPILSSSNRRPTIGSHRTTPFRPFSHHHSIDVTSSVDQLQVRPHRLRFHRRLLHRRPLHRQLLPAALPAPRSNSSASSATASSRNPTICSSTSARTPMRGLTRATFAERLSGDRIICVTTGK